MAKKLNLTQLGIVVEEIVANVKKLIALAVAGVTTVLEGKVDDVTDEGQYLRTKDGWEKYVAPSGGDPDDEGFATDEEVRDAVRKALGEE